MSSGLVLERIVSPPRSAALIAPRCPPLKPLRKTSSSGLRSRTHVQRGWIGLLGCALVESSASVACSPAGSARTQSNERARAALLAASTAEAVGGGGAAGG